MKNSLYNIVLALSFLTTAGVGAAFAQDGMLHDYEITETERDRFERDKVIFSPGGEGEARYVPGRTQPTGSSSGTNPKDSTASTSTSSSKPAPVVPAVRKEAAAKNPTKQMPPKQDDDAILTFNFLYYIIQKYKLQEIIQ